MHAVVYPADLYGCGHHRAIWPAQALQRAGHSIEIVAPHERKLRVFMAPDGQTAVRIDAPEADVIVFQRLTHAWIVAAIPLLRARGTAVVVDVDDDLAAVHPSNPAFAALHPSNGGPHSWLNLARACRQASLVTVSTTALLARYAAHGRGRVIGNTLAEHYFGLAHADSNVIAWPATIHSHPDDPGACGPAIARLVDAGERFRVIGHPGGAGRPFRLPADPEGTGNVELADWPRAIAAGAGVGIVPLADTRFNQAKSYLKGIELASAGVPFVASPAPEYRRLHRLGAGLLADRPKDWYRLLRRLTHDEAERVELAEQGRAVAATLRLEDHAWRWWQAWSEAVDVERAGRRVAS